MIVKWMLVAVFFLGDTPVESGLLGAKTKDDCETAKKISIAYGHGKGLDVWADCLEVKKIEVKPETTEKPKGEPGTEQRS